MNRNVGSLLGIAAVVGAMVLTGCCHDKPWPLAATSALNTSHAASQEMPYYRAEMITAGQPTDNQGSMVLVK